MTKTILVPLRGTDRIELFLPALERLAGPGTKVIFFVHYGVAGFQELMEQLLAAELDARPEPMRQTSNENPHRDRVAPGKRTILPALDALKKKGAQIEVNLYGLTKTLQDYVARKRVSLITRPEPGRTDENHDDRDFFKMTGKILACPLEYGSPIEYPL